MKHIAEANQKQPSRARGFTCYPDTHCMCPQPRLSDLINKDHGSSEPAVPTIDIVYPRKHSTSGYFGSSNWSDNRTNSSSPWRMCHLHGSDTEIRFPKILYLNRGKRCNSRDCTLPRVRGKGNASRSRPTATPNSQIVRHAKEAADQGFTRPKSVDPRGLYPDPRGPNDVQSS